MAPPSSLAGGTRLSIGVVALGGIPPWAEPLAETLYGPAADGDSMHTTTAYSPAVARSGMANR